MADGAAADPIAELVTALDRGGQPPLAWVVRWSVRVCGVCRGDGQLTYPRRGRYVTESCYACRGARGHPREPVEAAWRESACATAMVMLLALAGRWDDACRAADGPGGAWTTYVRECIARGDHATALGHMRHSVERAERWRRESDDGGVWPRPSVMARICADDTRGYVPTPPTLAELLAARATVPA